MLIYKLNIKNLLFAFAIVKIKKFVQHCLAEVMSHTEHNMMYAYFVENFQKPIVCYVLYLQPLKNAKFSFKCLFKNNGKH